MGKFKDEEWVILYEKGFCNTLFMTALPCNLSTKDLKKYNWSHNSDIKTVGDYANHVIHSKYFRLATKEEIKHSDYYQSVINLPPKYHVSCNTKEETDFIVKAVNDMYGRNFSNNKDKNGDYQKVGGVFLYNDSYEVNTHKGRFTHVDRTQNPLTFEEFKNYYLNIYKTQKDEQKSNSTDSKTIDDTNIRRTTRERFEISLGGCGDGLKTSNRISRKRSVKIGERHRSKGEGLRVRRRTSRSLKLS